MNDVIEAINASNSILIIQAENPDADSLASSLALEEILGPLNKTVTLYCAVDMPKYLRYLQGWDRVSSELPVNFDQAVIVDAGSRSLLERLLEPANLHLFQKSPIIVIDHHATTVDLPVKSIGVLDENATSTGELIANLAYKAGWNISAVAADFIATSIMADTLGLSSPKVSAESVHLLAQMLELGANLNAMDERRRELSKKSLEIFHYKGRLFERVELALEGQIAHVTIPWEEISEYSDQYNPSMLILDEMRQIEGVRFGAAFKTYPDGKITVKLRANNDAQFMNKLAEHFGGGGHQFAAGFKVYDMPLEALKTEFLKVSREIMEANNAS